MYPNLNAELSRYGVKKQDLAKTLGVSNSAVYKKLSGISEITFKECRTIRDTHLPGLPLDYLFKEAGDKDVLTNRANY